MPSSLGVGFAAASENHYLRGPNRAFWPKGSLIPVPLALYLHGATGTALTNASDAYEMRVIRRLASRYFVLASDWGGDTFANDTGIARVHAGISAARAAYNLDDSPVIMVGMSMGTAVALAYAKEYPQNVRAIAGMIPGLDLNDVKLNNRGGLAASLNAAYGGSYDDAVHGPDHNPMHFADELSPDLPVRLWTSTNDTYSPASVQDNFMSVRPETIRTSLGAAGHSTASINGRESEIADWAISLLDT